MVGGPKNIYFCPRSELTRLKRIESKTARKCSLGVIQWLRGHNFALFWPLPTSTWTFFTLNVDKNRHFLNHLPPLLVNVVIECPLPWRDLLNYMFDLFVLQIRQKLPRERPLMTSHIRVGKVVQNSPLKGTLYTPARTLFISGLKSRDLKLIFLT